MIIIRKKNQLKKTWEWKIVEIDFAVSVPEAEVYTTISVHKSKKEAQAELQRLVEEAGS